MLLTHSPLLKYIELVLNIKNSVFKKKLKRELRLMSNLCNFFNFLQIIKIILFHDIFISNLYIFFYFFIL